MSEREITGRPDDEPLADEPLTEEAESGLAMDRRKVAQRIAIGLVIVIGLYLGLSQLAGISKTWDIIKEGDPEWIAIALGINVLAFVAYIAQFRGVIGQASGIPKFEKRINWSASYQITLAGLAATRVFSAGGVGGVVLTYWALRRAGMERRDSAQRMVAFLVVLYTIYMMAVVACGVLLRTGVLHGTNPVGMTIVAAALAGLGLIIIFLVSLIPQDLERLIDDWARGHRRVGWARRIAAVPSSLAAGTRTALRLIRHPTQAVLAVGGAAGFWAANIGVLWACFHAFGEPPTWGVLIQGFFVGMTANLIPSPGGVGAVDAGMFGAFVAFGLPSSLVLASVLAYRAIAYLLPIPPGVIAYLQLRRTVATWQEEDRAGPNAVSAAVAPGPAAGPAPG